MSACDTPISVLADRVQERLEETVGTLGRSGDVKPKSTQELLKR